jgi:hypothetical protein
MTWPFMKLQIEKVESRLTAAAIAEEGEPEQARRFLTEAGEARPAAVRGPRAVNSAGRRRGR